MRGLANQAESLDFILQETGKPWKGEEGGVKGRLGGVEVGVKGASDGGAGGGQDGLVGQARSNDGQSRTVDTIGAVGGIQRDIFKTEPWAPHPLLDMMNKKKNDAGMSSWDASLEAG